MASLEVVPPPILKLIVVGNGQVGKSSLIQTFKDGEFTEAYRPTIGTDFTTKQIKVNGHDVKLQMWDSAGQERFQSVSSGFYRGSNGILLVFDVTNRQSFEHIGYWMHDIEEYAEGTLVYVIGTKSDLTPHAVSGKEVRAMADKYQLHYRLATATDADGINSLFLDFVEKVVQSFKPEEGRTWWKKS